MKYRIKRFVEPHHGIDGVIELEPLEEVIKQDETINPFKPTYKVGDKVRVVDHDASHNDQSIGDHGFKIGTIVKIEEIKGKCLYCNSIELEDDWCVHVDDVVPFTEPYKVDDSWKVTYDEWRASPMCTVDFTNSKLKPYVDKVKELEARNKELENAVFTEIDKLKKENKSLEREVDFLKECQYNQKNLIEEERAKYSALKVFADRMYKLLMLTPNLNITTEYEKLTK